AGDEGKGKISAYLSLKNKYEYCIRVGGPNAGHTTFFEGKIFTLKNIPSGFVNKTTKLVLGAGCYVITDWLLKEIELTQTSDRIIIDPHVVVITAEQTERERQDARMMKNIGSVGTGLGEAVGDRIKRREIKFAKDEPALKGYIADTAELLNRELGKGAKMLLEGTQGMKLSLLHGDYPFVTSRDTTASTFMGEAGLGPKYAGEIYGVFKPYVSKVGPGPIEHEITDEAQLKKYHTQGREVGSVSGRLRRIGSFEMNSALKAVRINSITKIAITHIDLFEGNSTAKSPKDFTAPAKEFIKSLDPLLKTYPHPKLSLISTGPGMFDIIDLE
ncbi:MAG: adenylosuccinate synthetase, partial [Elusimicrobia bacterium]|nr:adenylosuccinate synthetase [Elusimicrobiota bacterium]